jgi:hypothetical protein
MTDDGVNLDAILLHQEEEGDDHGHLKMEDRLREGRGELDTLNPCLFQVLRPLEK